MKTIYSIIILGLFSIQGISQSACSKFYPMTEGTTSQITSYTKKGKVAAKTDFTIKNVRRELNAELATVHSVMRDKKDQLIVESNFDVVCSENIVSIDFKSMVSPHLFEQYGDAEMDVTGTNVELPNDLSVGQTLSPADINIKVKLSGITLKMYVGMEDRKVIGRETITTPAGTFNCFVITYTSKMKMGINQTGSAKQWIAEGVGMVKQEDYNRSGRVTSSSLLTEFSN